MRYLQIGLLAAFGVALLTLPSAIRLGASDSDVVQEMKDRREIEALMWRYVRALDTRDPDAYASNYTPDGQFIAGQNATKGTESLKKMVEDLRNRRAEREK